MSAKFRDVLQCIDGPRKGVFAQIVGVNNGEVELLHRPIDGEPNYFTIETDELKSWAFIGIALVGPKPKDLSQEPARGTATAPHTATEEDSHSSDAAPANPLKLEPLKIHDLLEPLPANVKAVPMNAAPVEDPALDWGVEEPAPEKKVKRGRRKRK